MQRPGAHRPGAGHRSSAQLDERTRAALERDPAWQYYTHDQRWICPFCLTAVRSPQPGRAALMRAIDRHLSSRCQAYRADQPPRSEKELQARVRYEDIAHSAVTDPAYQVFDHEGYWYSPATLERIDSVRLHNRRFEASTIQRMVEHLVAQPRYRAGDLEPAHQVQAARDRRVRSAKLASNIQRLISHSIWRYRDAEGHWVCPYCLDHVAGVEPHGEDWSPATYAMADHLLTGCSAFGPQSQVMHRESEVAAAAGQATPSRGHALVEDPSQPTLPNIATPAGTTPEVATPLRQPETPRTPAPGAPRQPTPPMAPIATPLPGRDADDDEPSITPPRTPLPGGFPRVATPLPEPASEPERPPRVATPLPEPERPPRVATPLPEPASEREGTEQPTSGAGLFGTSGESAVRGSLLDQLASEEQARGAEDEGSAVDATPLTGLSDADDPLSWMDDDEDAADMTPTAAEDDEHRTDILRARDVQQKLLREAPEIPGYRFATRFEAAEQISGDFYEFIELPDGRLGFAQGDVSGHGMQAGLIMSMAKKVLAIYARMGQDPSTVLAAVNDAIADDLGGKMFVTMTYAILDPAARTITWARGGHNPTIHFNLHEGEITELKPPGMVVGMKGGPLFAKTVRDEVTQVRSGDLFLVYTDGVTETMNRQGEEYDTDRLYELIKTHAPNEDVDRLLDRILDSLRGFRGGNPADDDITLLALAVD